MLVENAIKIARDFILENISVSAGTLEPNKAVYEDGKWVVEYEYYSATSEEFERITIIMDDEEEVILSFERFET